MYIAVLSDIHDHLGNLQQALSKIRNADVVLCCGDFCAPFTLKTLADGFPGPVHAVFGNNDGDVYLLMDIARKAGNVTFHKPLLRLDLDGKHIAVAHYPEIGEALARSGQFDAVFSGHNHIAHSQFIDDTLWGNPGEIMGRLGKPSYGLYNTRAVTFEIHALREEH